MNTKKCVQNTRKVLEDFGRVTPLHGVHYVTEQSADIYIWVFWFITIAVCNVLCAIEMAKVYQRWQTSPVITSLTPGSTSVTNIPFPSVTICPDFKVMRSKLDVQAHLRQYESNNDSIDKVLQHEVVNYACRLNDTIPDDFRITKEHLQLLKDISPSVDDIFEECVFQGTKQSCSEYFRPIMTDSDVCFTFNMLQHQEIFKDNLYDTSRQLDNHFNKISYWNNEHGFRSVSPAKEYPYRERFYLGQSSGFSVTLKIKENEVQHTCQHYENFKVSIYAPWELPIIERRYFEISPGSQFIVALRPDKTEAESALKSSRYTSEIRGCNFPNEKQEASLFVFRNNTKQNCITDSVLRTFYEKHKCTPEYFPMKDKDGNPVKFCSESEHNAALNTFNDTAYWTCLPSCYELNYRYHVTTSALHNYNSESTLIKTKLVIYFEEESFVPWAKKEQYAITDFIANCGGILGLFTGFSFISGIEMIYFASLRNVYLMYKKRRSAAKPPCEEVAMA